MNYHFYHSFGRVSAAILFLLSASFVIFAQSPILRGRVTDSNGAGVSGAVVTARARSNQLEQSATTNSNGEFAFERLPSGDYIIEAASAGFARSSQSKTISNEAGATLDFQLEVAGLSEQVVVTASGTAQTADEISKAITVVSADEIERRNEFSISEALRNTPGLRIKQLGGPGTFTTIRTRGLRPQDTAILVDGLRFRDASDPQGSATPFIEELFVVNTAQIEVLRGSGSSLYGSNAIGGTINLLTNAGGGKPRGQIQLEGGSLGLFRGRAQVSGGIFNDRLKYSGGLAHLNVTEGVNGDVPARSWSGQGLIQFNFTPKISLTGRIFGNSAFLALTGSPSAAPGFVPPPLTQVNEIRAIPITLAQQRALEARQPVSLGNANYVPNVRDPDNRRDSHFLTTALTFRHSVNRFLNYQLSFQNLPTNRTFTNGTQGIGFQPAAGVQINDINGGVTTFRAAADFTPARWLIISGGYEFERELYRSTNSIINAPTPFAAFTRVSQTSDTGFLQSQFRLLDDRLQISVAGRVQSFKLNEPEFSGGTSIYLGRTYEAPESAYTGDASASYFFVQTNTKLRAHVGTGYRAPAVFERFGSGFFNGVFTPFGDPRIAPEETIGFDAGVDQSFLNDRLRLSASYFYTRLKDVIVFDSTGLISSATDPFRRSSGYVGTGGGLARGVEFSLQAKLTKTTTVTTAYTYTNSDNRTPTSVPRYIPAFQISDHVFSVEVFQQLGKRVDVAFDFSAASKYSFPLFVSAPAAIGSGSRAFVFAGPKKADVVVGYTLPVGERSIRFYGKIDNITDSTIFEDGFRGAGRTFIGGAAFRF